MKINAESLMEDRKLKTKKPKDKNGNLKIVLIAIAITIILIAIIMVFLIKVRKINEPLKVFINGKKINVSTSAFIIDDGKVYVNIKELAPKLGYEAHSGEYKIEAEDTSKVFVENKEETASMYVNSKIINKIEPNSNEDYKNYEMSDIARNINGNIYIISDGFEIACNSKLKYGDNTVEIQGLDFLYESYKKGIQEVGYTELSDSLENRKAIRYNRLVVKNTDERYGVIDLSGNEIIGTRYSDIQFDEYTQQFTITNQSGQMGIDYIDGTTKISVKYEEIKNISKDNELYLVQTKGKYGIINGDELIVIHMEYDSIGVDISPYINKSTSENEEKSKNIEVEKKYIFFNKLIPVEQNGKYGFFDIKGNKVTDLKYIGIGCYNKVTTDSRGRIIEERQKNYQ